MKFTLFILLATILMLSSCSDNLTSESLESNDNFVNETENLSYSNIFNQFEDLEKNNTDISDTDFLKLVELMELENPTFQETENALVQTERLTANDKMRLYVQLGENELIRLENEGFDISEDKEVFQKVMQAVSLANEHSLKENGIGFYDLNSDLQSEYLNSTFDDSEGRYKSSCPVESFPKGLYGVSANRYYSAYKTNGVKNNSGEWFCDTKIWFKGYGYAWASTSSRVSNFIVGAYGGILNSQNKRHLIAGIKMYSYGVYPSTLKRHLKLAY